MEFLTQHSEAIVKYISTMGLRVLYAIIMLIVGLWVIKILKNAIDKAMTKTKVDLSLQKFLLSFVGIIVKLLLVIAIFSKLEIEMNSFIAILGAAGLAVGLALQGSLANFAGGVLILLFRPFKIGDYIEAHGYSGSIKEIQIFNTILTTPDNKIIILPNGPLSNSSITNYSTAPNRRVDMTFGIGYSDDLLKAKKILNSLAEADERIFDDPAPMVAVGELADSSVNFVVRAWCKSSDYWGIYFDMMEKVKIKFDKEGISIPFPQQDVHLYKHDN